MCRDVTGVRLLRSSDVRALRARWWLALVVASALASGCGAPEIRRQEAPLWCPEDVPAAEAVDARKVLGMRESAAAKLARKAGCTMVVMQRDDEVFATTADYDPRRLKVEVMDGIVTRLYGVD